MKKWNELSLWIRYGIICAIISVALFHLPFVFMGVFSSFFNHTYGTFSYYFSEYFIKTLIYGVIGFFIGGIIGFIIHKINPTFGISKKRDNKMEKSFLEKLSMLVLIISQIILFLSFGLWLLLILPAAMGLGNVSGFPFLLILYLAYPLIVIGFAVISWILHIKKWFKSAIILQLIILIPIIIILIYIISSFLSYQNYALANQNQYTNPFK